MALYYKKVDAIQFKLTEEDKAKIKTRERVYFEGGQVKHVGGSQYLALLQQGENLHRIYETQWLIRHPDGLWQIVWPDHFNTQFIPGNESDQVRIGRDPFQIKSYNQPNTLI